MRPRAGAHAVCSFWLTRKGKCLHHSGRSGIVAKEQETRKRGTLVLLFASLAILASISRLHSTPAFLAGAAGGVLLVVGIFLIAKK